MAFDIPYHFIADSTQVSPPSSEVRNTEQYARNQALSVFRMHENPAGKGTVPSGLVKREARGFPILPPLVVL